MNADLRKQKKQKKKKDFEKDSFKLMKNAVLDELWKM